MLLLRDIVILGQAAPEVSKKYGKTVCVAAWQQDLGLIRLYPCFATNRLKRWHTFDLEVERPGSKDTRAESWKIVGNKKDEIPSTGRISKREERRRLLDDLAVDCVANVNADRRSLCVVKPSHISKMGFRENKDKGPETVDMVGGDFDWVQSRDEYSHSPVVHFNCSGKCNTHHKQTVIDWCAFEHARSHPGRESEYWDNINQDGNDVYLVLGNQAHQRNSFIVIQVIAMKSAGERGIDCRDQIAMF